MDSLTQVVLGASVAAAVAPREHRRAALLAGAVLGTLPDLDSLVITLVTADPVTRLTMHRSFSHSLLVLIPVAFLLWGLFYRWGKGRVAQAPGRWLLAIMLALITHPLLDAFTIYGTQLWWPFRPHPTMWGTVFIADPAYTLWLIAGCVCAWLWRERQVAQRALVLGLCLSSFYLCWSVYAKMQVGTVVEKTLARQGLENASYFSVPLPLNTLLWRVVAMTPTGYSIADYSLVADRGRMYFHPFQSEVAALRQVSNFSAVRLLIWFNRGFMRAQIVDGQLVLSDLRMGVEPDYVFNYIVAKKTTAENNGDWQPVAVSRLPGQGYSLSQLGALWRRIWQTSDQLFPDNKGEK